MVKKLSESILPEAVVSLSEAMLGETMLHSRTSIARSKASNNIRHPPRVDPNKDSNRHTVALICAVGVEKIVMLKLTHSITKRTTTCSTRASSSPKSEDSSHAKSMSNRQQPSSTLTNSRISTSRSMVATVVKLVARHLLT